MKKFISLQDFLLLRDPYDKECPRSAWSGEAISPEHLVLRYILAKKAWEQYGDEGPPSGTLVETFVHPKRLKMIGINEKYPMDFSLKGENATYSYSRFQWWLHFIPVDSKIHDSREWFFKFKNNDYFLINLIQNDGPFTYFKEK